MGKAIGGACLLVTLGTCGFCGCGTWSCVGEDMLLDLPDGAPTVIMRRVPGPPTTKVFPLEDGSLLRWTSDDRLVLGKRTVRLSKIRDVELFPQRDRVAVLTEAGAIQVLSMPGLRGLLTLQVDSPKSEFRAPFNIAVSPDGKWLASQDATNRVIEWDARNGQVKTRSRVPADRVLDASYDPDGSLWTTFEDRTDFREKTALVNGPVDGGKPALPHFSITHDGRFVGPNWEINVGGTGWKALPSPDGKLVAFSMSGNTGMWTGGRTAIADAETGRNVVWLRHPRRPLEEILWWQGKLLAGGSMGYLGLFEPASGHRVLGFDGTTKNIRQIEIHGRSLFVVDDSGTVMTCHLP